MHRSATSLVAKALHEQDVHMGDRLLGAGKGNPHGHFECREAVTINDLLLARHGGSWDKPPQVSSELVTEVAAYVAKRSDRPMWGVKDPRLAVTWPAWLPHLEHVDLHVQAVWRNPDEIAASLARRDGTDLVRAKALAEHYHDSMSAMMDEVRSMWQSRTVT